MINSLAQVRVYCRIKSTDGVSSFLVGSSVQLTTLRNHTQELAAKFQQEKTYREKLAVELDESQREVGATTHDKERYIWWQTPLTEPWWAKIMVMASRFANFSPKWSQR